jgi:hypothetical protein
MMASPQRNDSRHASLWALKHVLLEKAFDWTTSQKFDFALKKSDSQRMAPFESNKRIGMLVV